METENAKPSTGAVKRPWEGTTLGVIDIVGVVFAGIGMAMLSVAILGGGAILSQMSTTAGGQAFPMASFIGTLGAFLLIPMILFFVLGIFIIIGIFKGQKWAIIVSIIFSVLALLSAFGNGIQYFPLALNAFLLYLEIMCVKHPFYNHK